MKPDPTKEEMTVFLTELAELSIRHGIWLGSCGCCQSIYIEPNDPIVGWKKSKSGPGNDPIFGEYTKYTASRNHDSWGEITAK